MTKAKAVKPSRKLSISRSGLAIAKALTKAYPKEAAEIVKVMRNASISTSASMTRKLTRVQLALESLHKGGK